LSSLHVGIDLFSRTPGFKYGICRPGHGKKYLVEVGC
jgi:hypothetical protein